MKTIEQMYNEAKALVEDRTYNIGEISEKTGLQKTANGWVKPSETNFGKVKQNKNGEWGVQTKQGKNSPFIKHKNESEAKNALVNYTKKEEKSKWKKTTDYLGRDRISLKTKQGGLVSIYETDNPNQKNNRFRVDTGTHTNTFNTMEEAKAFAEKHYGDTKENEPKENSVEKKTSSKSLKLPDEKSSFQTDVNRMKKLKKEDYKQYTIQLEKLHSKYPINKWKDLYNKTANDSACRITADTKIKLKKVVENKVKENA